MPNKLLAEGRSLTPTGEIIVFIHLDVQFCNFEQNSISKLLILVLVRLKLNTT